MLRGLYSAASGMFSLERRQEALTNNLANAQTPGFKKDETALRAFPQLFIQRIQDYAINPVAPGAPQQPGQPVPLGKLATGVYLQERIPSFESGPMTETNQPLDVAINDQSIPFQTLNGRQVKPAAFFAVQLPNGTMGYSRNGKWDLDANGNLVTSEGYRVLGSDGQPIQLSAGISKSDLQISNDGQLISFPNDPSKMKVEGEIGIAVAQNPLELIRLGGNAYEAKNPLPFIQNANPGVSLKQGFIEQSNVDAGQTMSDMMMTLRGYEANQKVISAYDNSLQQLYSVGKING